MKAIILLCGILMMSLLTVNIADAQTPPHPIHHRVHHVHHRTHGHVPTKYHRHHKPVHHRP